MHFTRLLTRSVFRGVSFTLHENPVILAKIVSGRIVLPWRPFEPNRCQIKLAPTVLGRRAEGPSPQHGTLSSRSMVRVQWKAASIAIRGEGISTQHGELNPVPVLGLGSSPQGEEPPCHVVDEGLRCQGSAPYKSRIMSINPNNKSNWSPVRVRNTGRERTSITAAISRGDHRTDSTVPEKFHQKYG